jgi:DNA-binding NarL/FixJ family response regulator
VLLDLVMPGLDGFGVMTQLRPRIPAGAFLPILVLTAELTPEAKRRALSEGATDFLTKPLDTVEVLLRIHNLLQTRALHLRIQDENDLLERRVRERTAELEEARAQILDLYRVLAGRNQELHNLVEQLTRNGGSTGGDGRERLERGAIERLSPREQEVLRLVAQGKTNAEVAGYRFGSVPSTAAVQAAWAPCEASAALQMLLNEARLDVPITGVIGRLAIGVSAGSGKGRCTRLGHRLFVLHTAPWSADAADARRGRGLAPLSSSSGCWRAGRLYARLSEQFRRHANSAVQDHVIAEVADGANARRGQHAPAVRSRAEVPQPSAAQTSILPLLVVDLQRSPATLPRAGKTWHWRPRW